MVQGQDVDVRIKWPNDVYGMRLKIGGILCQSAYRDQAFHVVIGTGINLSNRNPTTCIDALIEERHKKLCLPGTPATITPEVSSLLKSPPHAVTSVRAYSHWLLTDHVSSESAEVWLMMRRPCWLASSTTWTRCWGSWCKMALHLLSQHT